MPSKTHRAGTKWIALLYTEKMQLNASQAGWVGEPPPQERGASLLQTERRKGWAGGWVSSPGENPSPWWWKVEWPGKVHYARLSLYTMPWNLLSVHLLCVHCTFGFALQPYYFDAFKPMLVETLRALRLKFKTVYHCSPMNCQFTTDKSPWP